MADAKKRFEDNKKKEGFVTRGITSMKLMKQFNNGEVEVANKYEYQYYDVTLPTNTVLRVRIRVRNIKTKDGVMYGEPYEQAYHYRINNGLIALTTIKRSIYAVSSGLFSDIILKDDYSRTLNACCLNGHYKFAKGVCHLILNGVEYSEWITINEEFGFIDDLCFRLVPEDVMRILSNTLFIKLRDPDSKFIWFKDPPRIITVSITAFEDDDSGDDQNEEILTSNTTSKSNDNKVNRNNNTSNSNNNNLNTNKNSNGNNNNKFSKKNNLNNNSSNNKQKELDQIKKEENEKKDKEKETDPQFTVMDPDLKTSDSKTNQKKGDKPTINTMN